MPSRRIVTSASRARSIRKTNEPWLQRMRSRTAEGTGPIIEPLLLQLPIGRLHAPSHDYPSALVRRALVDLRHFFVLIHIEVAIGSSRARWHEPERQDNSARLIRCRRIPAAHQLDVEVKCSGRFGCQRWRNDGSSCWLGRHCAHRCGRPEAHQAAVHRQRQNQVRTLKEVGLHFAQLFHELIGQRTGRAHRHGRRPDHDR